MGYFLVVIASVLFGIGPTLATLLQRAGVDSLTIMMMTNGISMITLFVFLRLRGISLRISLKQFIALFFGGFFAHQATVALLLFSYESLHTGLCTMIHFIYPVLVMLVMLVFFKEKLTWSKVLCVLAAVAGIAMIMGASGVEHFSPNPVKGAIFALLSGVSYMAYVVSSEKSSFSKVNLFVALFYMYGLGFVFVSAYVLQKGTFYINTEPVNLLLTVAQPLVMVSALGSFSAGIRKIGASKAAILNTLEPVVSILFSTMVFGGKMTALTIVGSLLVLGASVVVALSGMRNRSAKI